MRSKTAPTHRWLNFGATQRKLSGISLPIYSKNFQLKRGFAGFRPVTPGGYRRKVCDFAPLFLDGTKLYSGKGAKAPLSGHSTITYADWRDGEQQRKVQGGKHDDYISNRIFLRSGDGFWVAPRL